MALLSVLHFPDERLRLKAEPVSEINDEIRTLTDDMLETMYENNGIGLAATQVNVQKRVIVIDLREDGGDPLVLINPEVLDSTGKETMEEGCLSVPGYYEKVTRAEKITARYLNRDGENIEKEIDGLLAVCIQHEIDHLDGKLFIDYISRLKFARLKRKLKKERMHNL